jgi:hypothetical protein
MLLIRFCDFYGLGGTLNLAGTTENAFLLVYGIRLLFRQRVSRGVYPVENADRTNRDAYAVSVATVLVNSHVCTMNPKFFWRLHLSANRVTSVFADNRILL